MRRLVGMAHTAAVVRLERLTAPVIPAEHLSGFEAYLQAMLAEDDGRAA